jgi:hypothetical protein
MIFTLDMVSNICCAIWKLDKCFDKYFELPFWKNLILSKI